MLLITLGLLDLAVAVVIILAQFKAVPWTLIVGSAAYIFAKGFMFRGDIASFFDMFCAVYLIVLLFWGNMLISCIFASYLAIKAFMSFGFSI